MSMTPIERLRDLVAASKMSNVHWDGAEDLATLLAAYDARGKYIALLEQNQKEYSHHTGHFSAWDRATCAKLGCRLHQAKNDADSAVARVEGER